MKPIDFDVSPAALRERYARELAAHREWLLSHGVDPARWERGLELEPEAAIVEALARDLLEKRADRVWPNEDSAEGGADFGIEFEGNTYIVEATALKIDTVTLATGIAPDHPPKEGIRCQQLAQSVLEKSRTKAKQLAGIDVPGILLIGTLHPSFYVGALTSRDELELIVTGVPKISAIFNTETGEVYGERNVVDLQESSVAEWDKTKGIDPRRRTISAIVLAPFASGYPPRGILHPDAVRPIDFLPLRGVEYGVFLGPDEDNQPSFDWRSG